MIKHRLTRPFTQVSVSLVAIALICFAAAFALPAAAPAGAQGTCAVTNTPYFTEYNGNITVDGASAPIDAVVEAFSPSGVRTGCFVVAYPGIYGYMRVYGADPATGTLGMGNNQAFTFKVNGATAQTNPTPVNWTSDQAQHQVQLTALSLPPKVDDLGAEKAVNGVKLTWTHVGGSIHHYEVWRGATPYFTPVPGQGSPIAPSIAPAANIGDAMSFTDTASHLGNPAIEDYYVVLAVRSNGDASPVSNRVGAFDYSLQPGG